ncbi:fatty acid desaturase family protein [Pendulispora albinea]|uniref:Fatty acid desaturase n=1 Tax=Pendulispora albinea TaxID=2741071 RepID=A0ABZ2LZ78_9BACT
MVRSARLPTISRLGRDLLETRSSQRWRTLARPFGLLGLYAVAYRMGWWFATPAIVFLVFVAIVTSAHDVVHGSLGLGRRGTEWALFALGAVLLASGHSYRTSHLQHHRVFPGPDDPEGDPARMTFWGAVRHGPSFLPRLWYWAWKRSCGRERRWLLAEALWAALVLFAGIALWPATHAVLVYAAMVHSGAWVFPLLTVHLPHRDYGETPLTQTHTLRGRIVPALFLELTYHLEHHLYPQVPSHNLAKLSRRLDPVFREAGVVPWRVP